MRSSSLYLFMDLLSCFHLIVIVIGSASSSKHYPLCHDDESSALLQFKQSFLIDNQSAYGRDPFAYPKTASWKAEESGDCCSWDGVQCDHNTGHVIGLDLSSSFLYGSINSSSSLFRLVHLLNLSLANNNFNYSQIPSTISHLSRLTYLDLSSSVFSGQVPSKVSELSRLISLNLSYNVDPYSFESLLKLEKRSFKNLLRNLTNLKELTLSQVNISSVVPHILANFSSLTSLSLRECGLYGEFPTSIFQLPNLQILSVSFNPYLTGYLPAEFNKSSPLKMLYVTGTSFSGEIPYSIGNLDSLNYFDMSDCNFSGSVPSSLGNLTQLTVLGLGKNKLHGSIPLSIFNLVNLEEFVVAQNKLNGTVKFCMFSKLKNLTYLELSFNDLSVITNTSINATLPKFRTLGLVGCNLGEFPNFLQHQDELDFLALGLNKIQGQIPKWIWNLSMQFMSVDYNFIRGFEQPSVVLQSTNLRILDLSYNILQGSLPIPPLSIVFYSVSGNSLVGKISPLICNLTSLQVLDVSDNNLKGTFPQCLGNFSDSLSILNLGNNNFHGTIPQTFMKGNKLKMLDLSQNLLQGPVPRSLANCKMLKILDLGNNKINDTFPSWLGTLIELEVLILRSNEFHGAIRPLEIKFESPNLRIIDLSNNSFNGRFPFEFFKSLNAMKIANAGLLTYMNSTITVHTPGRLGYKWDHLYPYSITITYKGTKTRLPRILEIFKAIDLSSNKFEGDIPLSIGNLKGLELLNFSNNIFTGPIPTCLANLTELESLDLSQNKLSGEIPQQLVELTFLAILNVSYNHLTGQIPQGKQFATFENNSFEGNSGLCGYPLSKRCENSKVSPPSPPLILEQGEDSKFPSVYDWVFILAGTVSGLVVGLVLGHTITTRRHEWFVETFGRRAQKRQRQKKRGRKNLT